MQSKTLPNIQKAQSEFGRNIGKTKKLLTQENSNERRTTVETIVQLPQQFGPLIRGETSSQSDTVC